MLAIFDQGAHTPCPTHFNLADYVLSEGARLPDKIALAVVKPTGAERWSYARLRAAVMGTANGLMQMGLPPGARVLMRLGNTVDFPVLYLGAIWAGLVPVPTSSQLTAPEVARMLALLSPALIVRDPTVACPDSACPVVDLTALRAWRDLPPVAADMGDPERLAYIVFTSGTSGRQRAVGHAHRAIWARRMMMRGWYDLRPDDRMMHAGAINWTYTLGTGLMDPWTLGATALIPAPGVEALALGLLMQRHQATLFAAAPGVYRNILKTALPPLPHLRHGLSAGEKLTEPLRTGWRDQTGTELYEAYGMSECSTFVSTPPGAQVTAGSLGRPQQGRRVAILGPDGPVPVDTPGRIAVARDDPGMMLEYIGAPDATAERFEGPWFITGDLGMMAADGQITYLGRDDDLMNAGGFRVSPLEVEAAHLGFEGLSEIAVTEVEIKPGVHVIAAFYTSALPLDETLLAAHAARGLARYKQPRLYRHVDSLPRNPNGKLLRKALRGL